MTRNLRLPGVRAQDSRKANACRARRPSTVPTDVRISYIPDFAPMSIINHVPALRSKPHVLRPAHPRPDCSPHRFTYRPHIAHALTPPPAVARKHVPCTMNETSVRLYCAVCLFALSSPSAWSVLAAATSPNENHDS